MREILFRGKFGNEWKYGFLSIEPKGLVIKEPYKDESSNVWHIDADTVGQYTGLKDENGTKIFEGDILEADVFKNLNRCKTIWTVEYKERFSQGNGYYFYGKNRRFNARATQSTIINTHATVIGNIYDNLELLKRENND